MTSIDIEAVQALLAKVQAAEGPSFALNREIGLLIGGWRHGKPCNGYPMLIDSSGNSYPDSAGASYDECFTESLDAAVALAERVLPNWPVITRTNPQATGPSRNVADVIFVPADEKAWGVHHEAGGATMPLALCAALLRALIARAEAEKDLS